MNPDDLDDKVVMGRRSPIIDRVLFVPGLIAGMAKGITISAGLGASSAVTPTVNPRTGARLARTHLCAALFG